MTIYNSEPKRLTKMSGLTELIAPAPSSPKVMEWALRQVEILGWQRVEHLKAWYVHKDGVTLKLWGHYYTGQSSPDSNRWIIPVQCDGVIYASHFHAGIFSVRK